jgi:hypothetical protein
MKQQHFIRRKRIVERDELGFTTHVLEDYLARHGGRVVGESLKRTLGVLIQMEREQGRRFYL